MSISLQRLQEVGAYPLEIMDGRRQAYITALQSENTDDQELAKLRTLSAEGAASVLQSLCAPHRQMNLMEAAAWATSYALAPTGSLSSNLWVERAAQSSQVLHDIDRALLWPHAPVLQLALGKKMTYKFGLSSGSCLSIRRTADAIPQFEATIPGVIEDYPAEQLVAGAQTSPEDLAHRVAEHATFDAQPHFLIGQKAVGAFFRAGAASGHLDAIMGRAVFSGYRPSWT